MKLSWFLISLLMVAGVARAEENALSEQEKKEGWELLFDGKSADQWLIGGEAIPAANVQDGCINPHRVGGGRKLYVMCTQKRYGNFRLACDFKVVKKCNSGIFFRMADPADPVQTGFEMQVFDSAGKAKPDAYDSGALYDVVPPARNAMRAAGEWNHAEIEARGSRVRFWLNGEPVIDVDLDKYADPGKNLDGSKNKFKKALKDFAREGHIGLQDHLSDVWYKNIKIKSLDGRERR